MQIAITHLFEKAYGKYGLGAFNVFNAEQIYAVFRGAFLSKMPVILQITPAAHNYLHPEILSHCIQAQELLFPDVDFTVHLDHGNIEHCIKAIESGFYNSVMIDASHEAFDENVRITREVVKLAHEKGIAVEAELGVLSGVEDDTSISVEKACYTDPVLAKEFVSQTQCDSLAIAVGTSHGAYKFTGEQGLQLDVLSSINSKLPGFPLVLHGASSVPYSEIERINNAGGTLKTEAKGTDKIQLLQAIKLGVCKINIATDMRLIWARVYREFFQDTPDLFDLVIPGTKYMNELEKFIAEKSLSLVTTSHNTI